MLYLIIYFTTIMSYSNHVALVFIVSISLNLVEVTFLVLKDMYTKLSYKMKKRLINNYNLRIVSEIAN